MRRDTAWILTTTMALSLALALPAAAGSVYSWVTEDGTYSFTDDSKRVPAKYKADAKKRTMGKLSSYEQLTPVTRDADYADRLGSRLEGLRSAQRPVAEERGMRGRRGGRDGTYFGIRTGSRTSLQYPIDGKQGAGAEPLVVEEVRTSRRDGITTRTMTVVRQGDRIVSVTAGSKNDRSVSEADERSFY